MAENPRLAMGRAFKTETDALPWNRDSEQLELWQRGETGFPFVDAGMRQLNRTGWMHNRLRMVTAQFLAKHLFIDWRLGESYFMSQLVDGDFAANNGDGSGVRRQVLMPCPTFVSSILFVRPSDLTQTAPLCAA